MMCRPRGETASGKARSRLRATTHVSSSLAVFRLRDKGLPVPHLCPLHHSAGWSSSVISYRRPTPHLHRCSGGFAAGLLVVTSHHGLKCYYCFGGCSEMPPCDPPCASSKQGHHCCCTGPLLHATACRPQTTATTRTGHGSPASQLATPLSPVHVSYVIMCMRGAASQGRRGGGLYAYSVPRGQDGAGNGDRRLQPALPYTGLPLLAPAAP